MFYLAKARLGSANKYLRAISAIYVTVALPGDSCQITPISLCFGLMHILARRYAVDMLFYTMECVLSFDWNSFRLLYTMDSIVMLWIFIYILAALMSTFDIYLLCWIDILASLWYVMTFKDPSIHNLESKWLVYDYTLTQPFELVVLRLIPLCVCVMEYLFLCVHFI